MKRCSFISKWKWEVGNSGAWFILLTLVCINHGVHAWIISVRFVKAREEISRTPTNVRGKSPLCVPLVCRVLSRIYLLGKKSQVAEGYKLPSRGPRVPPREIFWNEYALTCILRQNFEKCYSVCTDPVAFGWFFRYSYLYTVMITIFWGVGGKLLPLKYPR